VLIARAPTRISFAGGGTDFEAYYRDYGGLVISTTIDKYFYVFANLSGMDSVQITSSDYHTFFRQKRGDPLLWDGDLSLPRAFLHEFGIDSGIDLFLASEVPPGTGLGSSSTVSVALAKALSTLCGLNLSKSQLADLASYVEIEKLGMPIGRQDQYAAAFGGLNAVHFDASGIYVEPLDLAPEIERTLERRLLMFFTRQSRSAASILKLQHASTQQGNTTTLAALHELKSMAETAAQLLRSGDLNGFGALLDRAWQVKKRLARGISNPQIDAWYELARRRGAIGGKIAGAGGGGFLMIYCPEEAQESVTAALEMEGLARMEFRFDRGGAVVLMDSVPRVHRIGRPEFALGVAAVA
jgi:D-glycero-alpha-D-manno-heptose-7-phosphate kinase